MRTLPAAVYSCRELKTLRVVDPSIGGASRKIEEICSQLVDVVFDGDETSYALGSLRHVKLVANVSSEVYRKEKLYEMVERM